MLPNYCSFCQHNQQQTRDRLPSSGKNQLVHRLARPTFSKISCSTPKTDRVTLLQRRLSFDLVKIFSFPHHFQVYIFILLDDDSIFNTRRAHQVLVNCSSVDKVVASFVCTCMCVCGNLTVETLTYAGMYVMSDLINHPSQRPLS